MVVIDARGDVCPIPVIKTKKVLDNLARDEEVEVLVDNEAAVQNVTKFAVKSKHAVTSQKLGEAEYKVTIIVKENEGEAAGASQKDDSAKEEQPACIPDMKKKNTLVVISSDRMGGGSDELGAVLMKSFVYALSQQDELPEGILFYNGGAKLTCQDSPALEDIKSLEAMGVEILTCGTCLNYYGLTDQLQVGEITNMYVIVQKMTEADKILKPC